MNRLEVALGIVLMMGLIGCSKGALEPAGSKPSISDAASVAKADKPSKKEDPPVTEAELGVPFYPGSKPEEGSDLRLQGATEINLQTIRTTSDTPDKVADYYQGVVKGMARAKKETSKGTRVNLDGKLPSGSILSIIILKRSERPFTEVNIGVTKKVAK